MGKKNYLIEGVSGTGKTSVCHELRRRGYAAINGDRELRLLTNTPDSETDEERRSRFASAESRHANNLWNVEKVRQLVANQEDDYTFFCGGSRNFEQFIHQFDDVFVLDVDVDTLNERLDNRSDDDWGQRPDERDLILRLHATNEDIPSNGIIIDATQPLISVVDKLLECVRTQCDNTLK